MRGRIGFLAAALSALVAGTLLAHDMFLKLERYLLSPNAAISVPLINGTFAKSENAIARRRIADLSVAGARGRARLDTTKVSARGDTTWISLRTGEPGTYVIGASTRPNQISLSAKQFRSYLEEEGLGDVVDARAARGESDKPARERYAKHVKAVVQVGETQDAGFGAVLGYAAEIVPLDNPYAQKPGGSIRLKCLVNGQPTGGIELLAGGEGGGRPFEEQRVRTDAAGVAKIRLVSAGRWYAKFIRMVRIESGPVNYESNWATVTFEVR